MRRGAGGEEGVVGGEDEEERKKRRRRQKVIQIIFAALAQVRQVLGVIATSLRKLDPCQLW